MRNLLGQRKVANLNQILIGDFDNVVLASETSDVEALMIVNTAEFIKSIIFLTLKILPQSKTLNVSEKQKVYAAVIEAIDKTLEVNDLEHLIPAVHEHARESVYGNPYEGAGEEIEIKV